MNLYQYQGHTMKILTASVIVTGRNLFQRKIFNKKNKLIF